jgi:hypothetical protein
MIAFTIEMDISRTITSLQEKIKYTPPIKNYRETIRTKIGFFNAINLTLDTEEAHL